MAIASTVGSGIPPSSSTVLASAADGAVAASASLPLSTAIAAVGRVDDAPLTGVPLAPLAASALPSAFSSTAACTSEALIPSSVGSVWCVAVASTVVAAEAPSAAPASTSSASADGCLAEQNTHTTATSGICLPQAAQVFFADMSAGRVYPTFHDGRQFDILPGMLVLSELKTQALRYMVLGDLAARVPHLSTRSSAPVRRTSTRA